MANRSIERQRACAQCGTMPITGFKYCTSCAKARKAEQVRLAAVRRGPRQREHGGHKLSTVVCVVCARAVEKVSSPGRDAGKCCSRSCGFVLRRWNGEKQKQVTAAKAEFARWSRRAKAEPKQPRAVRVNTCNDCGADVAKGRQRCEPCRTAHMAQVVEASRRSDTYKRTKRAAKARRRALERGVEAERFDPYEIFNRDGWRCHMCGKVTPQRLRGSYSPSAPELDHIVPLARGGKHTRANTACSCRACNAAKSDRVLGQPSLLSLMG